MTGQISGLDFPEVASHLAEHPEVRALLLALRDQAQIYFEGAEFSVYLDPDEAPPLLVLCATLCQEPDKAFQALDRLQDEWWLDRCDQGVYFTICLKDPVVRTFRELADSPGELPTGLLAWTRRPILDFYLSKSFSGVLAYTEDQLEVNHDYIQFLFPLPERSKAVPWSPVLSPEEAEQFHTNPELKTRLLLALERMRLFFSGTTHWRRKFDHNHLRITRIIRSLRILGCPEEAQKFYEQILAMASDDIPDEPRWFWAEALKQNPAFAEKTS